MFVLLLLLQGCCKPNKGLKGRKEYLSVQFNPRTNESGFSQCQRKCEDTMWCQAFEYVHSV